VVSPRWLDQARHPCAPSPYPACGWHLWTNPWRPFQIDRRSSWYGGPNVTVLLPEGRAWWRETPGRSPPAPTSRRHERATILQQMKDRLSPPSHVQPAHHARRSLLLPDRQQSAPGRPPARLGGVRRYARPVGHPVHRLDEPLRPAASESAGRRTLSHDISVSPPWVALRHNDGCRPEWRARGSACPRNRSPSRLRVFVPPAVPGLDGGLAAIG
jgi:hypothetical protein